MPEEVKIGLKKLGLVLGTVGLLLAIGQSWLVIPYKVNALEAAVLRWQLDHELLLRIDERLQHIQYDQERERLKNGTNQ